MAVDRDLILRIVGSARGKPLSPEDVVIRAGLEEGLTPAVRRSLRALSREGLLEAEGKRFRVPAAPPPPAKKRGAGKEEPRESQTPATRLVAGEGEVIGTLTRRPEGYGFIANLRGGPDLFVPPREVGDALDGDLVRARSGRGRDGRPVAKTLEVVERRRQYAVGSLHQEGRLTFVQPRDEQLGPVMVRETADAKPGDVVRVSLDAFEHGRLFGRVISRLGRPGDPDVEVLSVAYGEGFSDLFPGPVSDQAEGTPDHVREEDRAGRINLTGLPLVTIDGADARDFDDAVLVERTPKGYRLVVAIADVTHYVRSGTALDEEALRRATSVYFPGHVLPMLPERLSNGICSLNPEVDRLCMVADMALDRNGRFLDVDLFPGVMRSHARCTYEQVARLLAGEEVPELEHVAPMLETAGELAERMTKARIRRGAIDFDLPEGHVLIAEDGSVSDIVRRGRNAAHRLIEEFMLAANEAVAGYFEARALPTVFRVHGKPDETKLQSFVDLAAAYGYELGAGQMGEVTPAELNDFLRRVAGRPEQRALNHLLLRSMMQAVYSSENIGHFGLAAPSYLHFTSPIRRYPDLMVHRLLKSYWARGGKVLSEAERGREAERLESVAVHCSERERAATSAEREIDAFYAAVLMKSKVGEQFEGTIASVAEFGLFVELDQPFVQGLIRAETIGADFTFDPVHHQLIFGSSKRSFRVGDRVSVEVDSANPLSRKIDFKLVESGSAIDVTDGAAPSRERRPARLPGKPGPGARGASRSGKQGASKPRGGGPKAPGRGRGGPKRGR